MPVTQSNIIQAILANKHKLTQLVFVACTIFFFTRLQNNLSIIRNMTHNNEHFLPWESLLVKYGKDKKKKNQSKTTLLQLTLN